LLGYKFCGYHQKVITTKNEARSILRFYVWKISRNWAYYKITSSWHLISRRKDLLKPPASILREGISATLIGQAANQFIMLDRKQQHVFEYLSTK